MTTLTFWWWGEDEAPGLAGWVARTASRFEATHPGVAVHTRLLLHDRVLTEFPRAVAAGTDPDLQFLWNGIYHMEWVWAGHLAALDDLLEPEELAMIGGGPQSRRGGRTYRVGWYAIPVVWIANRAVLGSAGVDQLPATWPEFWEACTRVQARGLLPVTAGDGEGDVSVWWLTHFLTQELSHPGEMFDLVLGLRDWQENPYHEHWGRLSEVADAGFLDAEALPLSLWSGLRRFCEGRSAFTLASGPMFPACRRALGTDAVVMVAPVAGTGALAGLPIVDTQGIGISARSSHPTLAAEFLTFIHAAEQLLSLWEEVRLFPADPRWNGDGAIDDADLLTLWRWYARLPSAPYVPNLVPQELHFRVLAEIGQQVLAGTLDGAGAGRAAAERSRRWRDQHPAEAELYRRWAEEVGAASGAAALGVSVSGGDRGDRHRR